MTRAELIALVVAVLAARWLFRAVFIPFAPCRWCRGGGNNPFSTAARKGRCWFCHGARERQVLGARSVHRLIQHVRTRNGWGK